MLLKNKLAEMDKILMEGNFQLPIAKNEHEPASIWNKARGRHFR